MYEVFHTWTLLYVSICADETTYATIVVKTEGGVV
jgi:hypothetical protein